MNPSGKSKKTSRKSEKPKRGDSKHGDSKHGDSKHGISKHGISKRASTKRSKPTGKQIENMEERMPYAKSHETKTKNVGAVDNKPHFVFKSQTTQWTSTPADGAPFGKRTIVDVENDHGIKRNEILDESGKTVERTTEPFKLGRAQTRPGLFLLHRALYL